MIIDFGRLGPESLALLRALFCIVDQPDEWVTESVAGERIAMQVSLPIRRHNLVIVGVAGGLASVIRGLCTISWGAMRAGTAACRLHPSRPEKPSEKRVWIGGEIKEVQTTKRSAGVFLIRPRDALAAATQTLARIRQSRRLLREPLTNPRMAGTRKLADVPTRPVLTELLDKRARWILVDSDEVATLPPNNDAPSQFVPARAKQGGPLYEISTVSRNGQWWLARWTPPDAASWKSTDADP